MSLTITRGLLFAVVLASFGIRQPAVDASEASCESLLSLALPNATITAAQAVPAGDYTLPATGPTANAATLRKLPAFCRVAATLRPSADSDIKIEVWMPTSNWNGRFQGVGNAGWAGSISYSALAAAITSGYASASTDTGHTGGTAAFALGHEEKLVDMAYRAVHEMSVGAKAIVEAHYGSGPRLSLWNGCSQGGRQGVTEAERYPGDYDAIVAGAPAVYNMALHGARVAIDVFVHRTSESYIPPEKYPAIHAAALEACDARDGVKDGVIEDPSQCRFDPAVLACKATDDATCLTPPQVETARALYAPVKNPKTGAMVSPALLPPGTELGWATLAGPQPLGLASDAFKYIVFKDPNWDWRRFDAATDVDLAIKTDHDVLGLTDPNLKPFFDRGGKLLMYHGWADPQVPSLNTVRYFDEIAKTMGKAVVGRSVQLYMVPGMGHCQGGPGTDTFDKVAAMDQWITSGRAPDQIVAAHRTRGTVDRTRPLCPYGQVAKWNGTGSTDDAANFSCAAR